MQRIGGLIAKDGAEGGFAAALPDGGAVAVKIDDGAARAADVAVARALQPPRGGRWRTGHGAGARRRRSRSA